MRRYFSSILIAWVGFACPILCAVRADAEQAGSRKGSCCGQQGKHEEPSLPGSPAENDPGQCFCSADGVLAEKSGSLQTVFIQPFERDVDFVPQPQVSQLCPETGGNDDTGPPFPRSDIPLLI
jgi:hypothetical protein